MDRRTVLSSIVALSALAGCASSGTDEPNSGIDPTTLLPPEGSGWVIERAPKWDASEIHENANEAVNARYSGPDGGVYHVVIIQWGSDPVEIERERAQSAIEGDVRVIIREGSVTLVATSVEGSNVGDLIDRSSTFDRDQ